MGQGQLGRHAWVAPVAPCQAHYGWVDHGAPGQDQEDHEDLAWVGHGGGHQTLEDREGQGAWAAQGVWEGQASQGVWGVPVAPCVWEALGVS